MVACTAGNRLWRLETAPRAVKADLKELNYVAYGLFNVHEWMTIVTGIIERKVDQLQVTEKNRSDLKAQLVVLMGALGDEVDRSMERQEEGGHQGRCAQAAISASSLVV